MKVLPPLPTIYVNDRPPKTNTGPGNQGGRGRIHPPRGAPPHGIRNFGVESMINGPVVFEAAERGDTTGALIRFLQGLDGKPASHVIPQLRLWAGFSAWMANGGWRTLTGGNEFGFTTGQRDYIAPLAGAYIHGNVVPSGIDYDFYGSALMPIAGIYYWVAGKGKPRKVHIDSLNLTMRAQDFKPLMDVIKQNSGRLGSYYVQGPFEHNIFSRQEADIWAAGLLGRVNGWVTGIVTIEQNGVWKFSGAYTINKDTYDADASNRSGVQEALTTLLSGIGKTLGKKNYDIYIVGSKSISYSGVSK